MKKTEIILVILSIIVLGLKLLLIPGINLLVILTLSALAMLYFYFGFALFNNIQLRTIFKKDSYQDISSLRILGAVCSGLALSMAITGILFKFLSWPGSFANLMAGLVGIIIVAIIGTIKYFKSKSNYYTKIFKRLIIFGVLTLTLVLIPQTTWIELKYRDNPALLDALKKSLADPTNKELQDKVTEEREKTN